MAKQLNIDLRFNADTSQAKKAIEDLRNTLSSMSLNATQASVNGYDKYIANATIEANKLKAALESAVNVKTGAIDLSKLQSSLKQSGSSIEQVSNSLINMGAVGQRAFQQFAATIAQAQVPTLRLNGMLGAMWTTLKNVARFQISSSIMHGLTGGLSSAFSYAQHLNESLNNIRIVTGQSADQMARFAREANATAKSLSATTLDYTNASLIYYQQGLNDQEVRERTDVTVKMANVTRDSAEAVSNQMTAIWNNFEQGSHTLEYFADVITALGATTASSSQEIATGLEKFAPIAGTIGLSYETATAALATIVANTRQSAETVGTGLRTIFSRIESLKLGQTLEDGVGLTKYTSALQTVGVNVLDINGKLKDADTILEDIAAKWQTLDQTQKTALATTVGGVRQYTNLIALFDNWDDMQRNMATAQGASGTLQGQADIYAESWEAARDRVQTALQGLYDSLINDKFFIDVLNNIEKLISGVDNFVQSIGGAKGVILGVSAAILTFANASISDMLSNMVYNIKSLTGIGLKEANNMRDSIVNRALNLSTGTSGESQAMEHQLRLQQTLNTYGKEYNEIQRSVAESLIAQQKSYDDAVISAERELAIAKNRLGVAERMQHNSRYNTNSAYAQRVDDLIAERRAERDEAQGVVNTLREGANENFKSTDSSLQHLSTTLMSGTDILTNFASGITSAVFAGKMLANTVQTIGDETASAGQKITSAITTLSISTPLILKSIKQVKAGIQGIAVNSAPLEQLIKNMSLFQGSNVQRSFANTQQLSALAQQLNKKEYTSPKNYVPSASLERIRESFQKQSSADIMKTLNIDRSKADAIRATAKEIAGEKEITAAIMREAAERNGVIIATKKGIIARMQESVATKLSKTNLDAHTASLLANVAPYALIAAGIAAVVAVIYLAVKAYNADADAAKKAVAAQKEANTELQNIKNNYNNLLDTIKKYDEAQAAIQTLTVGTQEWKDAIAAANEQVLSLLQTYPKLAKYVSNSTGHLTIEAAGFDELKEAYQNSIATAQQNVLGANLRVNNTANANNLTNLSRSIVYYSELEDSDQMTQSKATQSDLQAVFRAFQNNNNNPFTNLDEFSKAVQAEGIKSENLISALFKNQEAIYQLNNSIEANTAANNIYTDQIMSNQVNNLIADQYSDLSTAVIDFLGDKLADIDATRRSYWETDYKGQNDKEIQRAYADLMGWDITSIENKTGKGIYHLRSGEEYTVDDTQVRYMLNLNNEIIQLGLDTNKLAATFREISTIGNELNNNKSNKIGNSLITAVNGKDADFSTLTQSEVNVLQEAIGENLITSQLYSTIISSYAQLGYSSATAYWQALQNGLNNYNATWENILNGYGTSVSNIFTSYFNSENISLEQSDDVLEGLTEAFTRFGNEGANALAQIYSDAISKGIDPSAINNILSEVDWTSDGAIQELSDLLRSNHIVIDTTSEAWRTYIKAATAAEQTTNNLITTFNNIKSTTADATKVLNKLSFGDVISEKDYEALTKYNSALKALFSLDAGGYKFIGDEKTLQQYSTNISKSLASIKEEFTTAAKMGEDLSTKFSQIDFTSRSWTTTGHGVTEGESISEDFQYAMVRSWALDAGNNFDYLIQQAGRSKDAIIEAYEAYASGTATDENLETLNAVWNAAADIQQKYQNGLFESVQAEELWINTYVTSVKQLADALEMGKISAEAFNKTFNAVTQTNANALGVDYEQVLILADAYAQADNGSKLSIANYREMALQALSASKAIDKFKNSISEWQKVIKKGNRTSADYTKTILEMREAMAGLFGIADQKLIPTNWSNDEKVLESLEKAINGDVEALTDLGLLLASDTIKNISNPFDEITGLINNTLYEDFESAKTTVLKGIEGLQTAIDENKIKPGDIIESDVLGSEWINGLNEMAKTTHMSVDEMNAILSELGVKTNVGVEYIDAPVEVPEYTTTEKRTYQGDNTWTTVSSTVQTGTKTMDGKVAVAQITAGDSNGDNYPDVTYTGQSGGSSSSSKSSGGGGSKSKKHDEKKAKDKSRYKPIEARISDNERKLQQVSDKAERLAGKQRIAALKEEIKLRQQDLELQREYYNEIQKNLKIDTDDMVSKLAQYDITPEFDENGVITNFDEIEQKMIDIYNAKADIEMNEDDWKEFTKGWDEIKDSMDQYIETRDKLEEQEQKIIDTINEAFDKRIDMIQSQLDINLEISDDSMDYLEYQLSKIEDDAYSAAEAIALIGKMSDEHFNRAQQYRDTISTTLSQYGLSSIEQLTSMSEEDLNKLGWTQETTDLIRKAIQGLREEEQALTEDRIKAWEAVHGVYEKINEDIEYQQSLLEHYDSVIDHYKNILDLNGAALGEQGKAMQRTLDEAAYQNGKNAVRAAAARYQGTKEALSNEINALEAQLNSDTITPAERVQLEEQLRQANEALQEAEEDWLATWEENLQRSLDIFDRAIDDAVDDYNKAMDPIFGSLDYFNDAYGRQKEMDDMYQPEYEKLYNLSKMARDLSNSIDDTDSIRGKQALIKLQEKINALQKDGNNLSDYDIEALQKEIELEKARIALEDAKNAKSQVRLQRDEEGNWGYVYTAKEEDIANAEQAYEDALYAYQKLSDDYINDLTDKITELKSKAAEEFAELWRQLAGGEISQEEFDRRLQELKNYYGQMAEALQSQFQNVIGNQESIWPQYMDLFNVDKMFNIDEDSTLGKLLNGDQSVVDYFGNIGAGIGQLINAISTGYQDFQSRNDEINAVAGIDTADLLNSVASSTEQIVEASREAADAAEDLAIAMQEKLSEALGEALNWENENATALAQMRQEIEQMTTAWLKFSSSYLATDIPSIFDGTTDDDLWAYRDIQTGVSPSEAGKAHKGETFTPTNNNIDTKALVDELTNQTTIAQYKDTIMKAMADAVPEISEWNLEQDVHITAEFPNVSDHYEVEEAINNLILSASQYVNQK